MIMLFMDAIAAPYFLMLGGAGLILALAIACLIGLTVLIFALFQRLREKNKNKEGKDT